MTKVTHRLYVGTMMFIVVAVTLHLVYTGYSYYKLPIEERFYHPKYDWFQPAGVFGHGLGIVGTFLILFGVSIYIARKRYNFLGRLIRLKYLLEFHIFLCTLGPILVLFHTTFKFGGIVSVAFWSMVAVVLSGVIGRFIYIQIPRTIEGRALSLQEVQLQRSNLAVALKQNDQIEDSTMDVIQAATEKQKQSFGTMIGRRLLANRIGSILKRNGIDPEERKKITHMVLDEVSLAQKIGRLERMQQLFKYWHVAHLPFALIMLIIVVIHVIVTLLFGYKWIF